MTGEGTRTPSTAEINRRTFCDALCEALEGNYRGDGHYVFGQLPTFGDFRLTDYVATEHIQSADQLPTQELRTQLLSTRRPCLAIQTAQTFFYFVVYPEDLHPEGMLAKQFGALLGAAPELRGHPCILKTDVVEGKTVNSIVLDPFEEPLLQEMQEQLTTQ